MDTLSIVMPVYNEERLIEQVVRDVHEKILTRLPNSKLLVVNDGSRDNTPEILDRLSKELRQLEVLHKPNEGHGPTVLRGLRKAEAERFFLMDSDAQYRAEDFWDLWEKRDDADLLIGTREKRFDPGHRLLLTRIVRFYLYLLFHEKIRDANSPFKLMKRSLWEELTPMIPEDSLIPSIFIAAGAKRMGFTVKELPVTHLARPAGKSTIRYFKLLRFCVKAFSQAIAFRKTLNSKGPRSKAGETVS